VAPRARPSGCRTRTSKVPATISRSNTTDGKPEAPVASPPEESALATGGRGLVAGEVAILQSNCGIVYCAYN